MIWILVVAMCQQKIKFFLSVHHSPRLLVSPLWLVYEFSSEYESVWPVTPCVPYLDAFQTVPCSASENTIYTSKNYADAFACTRLTRNESLKINTSPPRMGEHKKSTFSFIICFLTLQKSTERPSNSMLKPFRKHNYSLS